MCLIAWEVRDVLLSPYGTQPAPVTFAGEIRIQHSDQVDKGGTLGPRDQHAAPRGRVHQMGPRGVTVSSDHGQAVVSRT